MSSAIMVVNFAVDPEQEAAFNRFYHRDFLPLILKEAPEVQKITRYEEAGIGGSLRWYDRQFLTIYELAGADALAKCDAIFERPAVASAVKEFRQWKERALRKFSRINFVQTWSHARKPLDGPFSGRPFFLWQLEMKPELDHQFQEWYEQIYLPLQIAEIPTWAGALRYQSVGREPLRHLTFFEANDEATLLRCITDLRAQHRVGENIDWQNRVQPAVTWHDATSFRPIFRMPG